MLQYLTHRKSRRDSGELYVSMPLSRHLCLDVSVFTSQSLRIYLHAPVPTYLSVRPGPYVFVPRLFLNVSVSTYLSPHVCVKVSVILVSHLQLV